MERQICDLLNTSSAQNIILQPLRAGSLTDAAKGTLTSLSELASKQGLTLRRLTSEEISAFVKEAKTKSPGSFNAKEYQELMSNITKYSALRARRSPAKRWTLGMGLTTAGAVAVGAGLRLVPAAAGISSAVLLAAGPVGVAVGAVAIGLDGRKLAKRDKKRALRYSPPAKVTVDTAAVEPATEPMGVDVPTADAAPAAPTCDVAAIEAVAAAPAVQATAEPAAEAAAALPSESFSSNSRSMELVGAVVDVSPPADSSTPFANAKDAPDAAPAFISLAAEPAGEAPAPEAAAAAAEAELPHLPELLRSATPEPAAEAPDTVDPSSLDSAFSDSVSDAAVLDHISAAAAQLPPLATKKPGKKVMGSKKLGRAVTSFKRVLSTSSSSDLDSAAEGMDLATPASSDGKPPSGFAAFRRSFSSRGSMDSSRRSMDTAAVLDVQASEGSATIRKMKEALRRSFTLNTPRASIDGSNSGKANRVRAF